MSAFKGFQNTGAFSASVKPTNMFAGFQDTTFGMNGLIGGVPSTNLLCWFNPSVNIVTSLGNVTSWTDITGNFILTASGTAAPTYLSTPGLFSGRSYLSFNGTSNIMTLTTGDLQIQSNNQFQIIIVAQFPSAPTSTKVIIISDITNASIGRYIIGAVGGDWYCEFTDSGGNRLLASATYATDSNLHMFSNELDRSGGHGYFSLDNQWHKTNVVITAANTNYNGMTWSLGGYAGGNFSQINVLDVLIYTGNLSQTDYEFLRGYMGYFYGF